MEKPRQPNLWIGTCIAVCLAADLFGYYTYRDAAGWLLRGRNAFLVYENHRFEGFASPPHYGLRMAFGVAVLVAIYELMKVAIQRIILKVVVKSN
jgi:hypothetical protein